MKLLKIRKIWYFVPGEEDGYMHQATVGPGCDMTEAYYRGLVVNHCIDVFKIEDAWAEYAYIKEDAHVSR
jgi:hypothetical protein